MLFIIRVHISTKKINNINISEVSIVDHLSYKHFYLNLNMSQVINLRTTHDKFCQ